MFDDTDSFNVDLLMGVYALAGARGCSILSPRPQGLGEQRLNLCWVDLGRIGVVVRSILISVSVTPVSNRIESAHR